MFITVLRGSKLKKNHAGFFEKSGKRWYGIYHQPPTWKYIISAIYTHTLENMNGYLDTQTDGLEKVTLKKYSIFWYLFQNVRCMSGKNNQLLPEPQTSIEIPDLWFTLTPPSIHRDILGFMMVSFRASSQGGLSSPAAPAASIRVLSTNIWFDAKNTCCFVEQTFKKIWDCRAPRNLQQDPLNGPP